MNKTLKSLPCEECEGAGTCLECGGKGTCPECDEGTAVLNYKGDSIECYACHGTEECGACEGNGKCCDCNGSGTAGGEADVIDDYPSDDVVKKLSLPKIVGVAVRHQGEVLILPRPKRHHHILNQLKSRTGSDWEGDMHLDQGFVDYLGKYLNRYEAYERAQVTSQILEGAIKSPRDYLMSEDIW